VLRLGLLLQNFTEFFSLYKALGGWWQIGLGNDFVPKETKQKMHERTDLGNLFNTPAQNSIKPNSFYS